MLLLLLLHLLLCGYRYIGTSAAFAVTVFIVVVEVVVVLDAVVIVGAVVVGTFFFTACGCCG